MLAGGVRGSVVAIEEPTGVRRKVAKIQPYKVGSAILTPYHAARAGYLSRFPVDYSKRYMDVPVQVGTDEPAEGTEVVSYTAANRVKLSFHEDGLVQFSGEIKGTIRSGKDAAGRLKGMGLMVNRLATPLQTGGPNFGLTISRLQEFDVAQPQKNLALFVDEDIYLRDCTADDWDHYVIEGFIMPRTRAIPQARLGPRGLILTLRFGSFDPAPRPSGLYLPTGLSLLEQEGAIFDLRLIELGAQNVVVGLLVSKSKSGGPDQLPSFTLSSPSDMHFAMFAAYPNPFPASKIRSLDYLPGARDEPESE